jgi:hypothetical protein
MDFSAQLVSSQPLLQNGPAKTWPFETAMKVTAATRVAPFLKDGNFTEAFPLPLE